MNKKAFTLAEILGVIVVIGLLLVIIAPTIINRINSKEENVEEAANKIIFDAASQYITENREHFPQGKKYCIKLTDLIEAGKLASPVKDVKTGKDMDNDYVVEVSLYSSGDSYYELKKTSECNSELPMIDFIVTPSGHGWVRERTVQIKYPNVEGTKEYTKNNDWQTYNNDDKIIFTENGTLSARIKGTQIQSKIIIKNVDSVKPKVEVSDISSTTCKGGNKVEIKLTDSGGSNLKQYAVTTSKTDPSSWIALSNKNSNTVRYEVLKDGTYYVHVQDIAGNKTSKDFKAKINYKVTFNPNGGSVDTTEKVITNSFEYGDLPNPTRTGYTFKGWYTGKTDGKKITNTTIACLSANQTLYAKWQSYPFVFRSYINCKRVIDIYGAGTANGTSINIWGDNGSNAQKWLYAENGDGTVTLKMYSNQNKCLDVDAAIAENGRKIQLYDCNGTNAQKWYVENSNGTMVFKSAINKSYCLDITWGEVNEGNNLELYSCNGTEAQKWWLNCPNDNVSPTCSYVDPSNPTTPVTVQVGCSDTGSGCTNITNNFRRNYGQGNSGWKTITIFDRAGNEQHCGFNVNEGCNQTDWDCFYYSNDAYDIPLSELQCGWRSTGKFVLCTNNCGASFQSNRAVDGTWSKLVWEQASYICPEVTGEYSGYRPVSWDKWHP